jgi:hypothetical protein
MPRLFISMKQHDFRLFLFNSDFISISTKYKYH